MYRKLLNITFIILIAISNTSYAETKIGVVKLDVLFQEIPIYKESQTNLKNQTINLLDSKGTNPSNVK